MSTYIFSDALGTCMLMFDRSGHKSIESHNCGPGGRAMMLEWLKVGFEGLAGPTSSGWENFLDLFADAQRRQQTLGGNSLSSHISFILCSCLSLFCEIAMEGDWRTVQPLILAVLLLASPFCRQSSWIVRIMITEWCICVKPDVDVRVCAWKTGNLGWSYSRLCLCSNVVQVA